MQVSFVPRIVRYKRARPLPSSLPGNEGSTATWSLFSPLTTVRRSPHQFLPCRSQPVRFAEDRKRDDPIATRFFQVPLFERQIGWPFLCVASLDAGDTDRSVCWRCIVNPTML